MAFPTQKKSSDGDLTTSGLATGEDSDGRGVVVIGGANLDVIARPETDPRLGQSTPGHVRLSPGGAGRNVAENLARLGERVRLIAGVADDVGGRWVMAQTASCGVDISGVTQIGKRGNYYIAIHGEAGVRWAVSDMSAAEALDAPAIDAQAPWVRSSTFVVIDANLSPPAIRRAVELAGSPICLLPTSPAKAHRLRQVLEAATLVVLSAEEARVLTERSTESVDDALQAAAQLRGGEDSIVVVTMGALGIGWVAHEAIWLPALPVPLVDPTGAGDAVAAGAIYSVLHGLDARASAALARAAGAMTVTVEGPTHPGLTVEALRAYG